MSLLALTLLGVFQLIDGESVILEQARLPELIAYIALQGRKPIPRQSLAFLFWPDSSEGQARTNLRNLLFKLRTAWPRAEQFIAIDRSEIRWETVESCQIDVVEFEAALAASAESTNPKQKEAELQRALALYKGDLLPDLYEDWVLQERERLRGLFLQALEQLMLLLEAQRRYDEAIDEAQRLLQADPLQETSHRHLMRLFTANGDRAAALRTYHTCVSILERELSVHPSAATQELYNRLLNLESNTPTAHTALIQTMPLVGRHPEWQQLMTAWQETRQDRAQLVVISGEAGIGKTRLAEELIDLAAHQGYTMASSRAYAAEGALSYAPVSEWLRRQPIRQIVAQMEPIWQVEIARLLPELLQEHPALPPPGPLREGWQKQRFFEGLARVFLAAPQPTLLHMDDLQWCDEETLTFLHYLLRSARQAQLLVVGTARSEDVDETHPLSRLLAMLRQDDLLREIELGPLSAEETARLATQTIGEAISDRVQDHLYRTSEGHPLFLIEMIRMRDAERGRETAPLFPADECRPQTAQMDFSPSHRPSSLPPKIQTIIGARLAQISSAARELAQLAAVVGREFSFTILQAASRVDEEALVLALDELWQRRIIREQGDDVYDFSHDRIREVTYAEISNARRRFLHRRAASALESIHAQALDGVSAQIAVHFHQAGDHERARHYYRRAADYAMNRFATEEAQRHLQAALALTPTTYLEERFTLLTMLQQVYTWQMLFPEWEETLDSMEMLAAALNDDRRRAECAVYRSKWFASAGQNHEHSSKAEEAIVLAEQIGATDILAMAYIERGSSYWDISRFVEARPLLQKGAELAHQVGLPIYEEEALQMLAALGMFTGMRAEDLQQIVNRCWAIGREQNHFRSLTSVYNKFGYLPVAQGEGEYDEARRWYGESLELSRSMGDMSNISQSLINLIVLETVDGNYAAGIARSEEFLALHQGVMTPVHRGRYLNYWGDLLTNVGLFEVVLTQQTKSLALLAQIGLHHFNVKTLVELAWLQHLMGDNEGALAHASEALRIVTGTGDTRYQAIALTRQGYALHNLGDLDAAAAAFEQGHTLHRQMEQFNRSMAPLAGLARIAMDRGDAAQAIQIADQIHTHLQSHRLDRTIEACRVHLTAIRILRAADDPRAKWVLQTAWEHLQQRAATIYDPDWLRHFWQVADHRAVVEAVSAAELCCPLPARD
ncbi:MAG: AAA family ATPase [Caldilineaceae bacterium]|nr:AAA family ATPase [Caldilineaceae bacterium]